jgi:hypothetical protein
MDMSINFMNTCQGKEACEFRMTEAITEGGCPRLKATNKIAIKASCSTNKIQFPSLGFETSRVTITWVIVLFDAAICLVFVLNTEWMQRAIHR